MIKKRWQAHEAVLRRSEIVALGPAMNFISSCSLLFYFFICISSLNIRATGVKQPVRNSKQKKKKLNTQPIPNVGKRATGVMHSETYMHCLERENMQPVLQLVLVLLLTVPRKCVLIGLWRSALCHFECERGCSGGCMSSESNKSWCVLAFNRKLLSAGVSNK